MNKLAFIVLLVLVAVISAKWVWIEDTQAQTQAAQALDTGRIKTFNYAKGFGYISPDGGGQDVYVHQSAIDMSSGGIMEGQRVQYEVVRSPKGVQAQNVRPISNLYQ